MQRVRSAYVLRTWWRAGGVLVLILQIESEYQPMNPTFERALWASTPALRCLAPLDAILAPALGL